MAWHFVPTACLNRINCWQQRVKLIVYPAKDKALPCAASFGFADLCAALCSLDNTVRSRIIALCDTIFLTRYPSFQFYWKTIQISLRVMGDACTSRNSVHSFFIEAWLSSLLCEMHQCTLIFWQVLENGIQDKETARRHCAL